MKKFIVLCCLSFLIYGSASAKTWRVNNTDRSADFETLDAAMAGITAGDTLYLEGSNIDYKLSSPIKKKVAIIGNGYFLTDNPNTPTYKSPSNINGILKIEAEGVLLEGLSFNSYSTTYYINIGADNVTIRRCCVPEIRFDDDLPETNRNIYNATITQCYIFGSGIKSNFDYGHNAVITNNIFAQEYASSLFRIYNSLIENNTALTSFSVRENEGCTIRNNIFPDIRDNNTNSTILANYIGVESDFLFDQEDSRDRRWKLKPDSPAMTAGTGNSQCGAFGGSAPYVLSGLPAIPQIYEIDAPSAASEASGLKVTVKIATEK
ncbi:MAG: hypothetical protein LUG18_06790 [Candidatus Azobacteroides sp.]|nr:hypothetical protein [Candidatus Azobacteroides sp.]